MKHIVSDLNGVLTEIQWQENVQEMLGQFIEINALHHLWVNANSLSQFERGKLDFDEFAHLFKEEFKVTKTIEEIQSLFINILKKPKDGCYEVLEKLQARYTLSLLSNTNPPHRKFLKDNYKQLFTYFERLFLSYEIGLIKPDREMYRYVLDCLKVEPSDVFFFDDGQKNVEAAAILGMNAFRVDSPQEILAIMNLAQED